MFVLTAISCGGNSESEEEKLNEEQESTNVDTVVLEDKVEVPEFKAIVDEEAMNQVGQYTSENYESAFQLYQSGNAIEERWTDKLWGRCCTEADLSLCEVMSFNVKTSAEGSKYPWSNATDVDNPYNTAYVFKAEDHIEITISLNRKEDQYLGPWQAHGPLDKILGDDTIMTNFQYSMINGYVKSEKTFKENARIEWVELWLNGEHMCNVKLLDTPEIQMLKGNFAFTKEDVVKLKPISYYKGSKYDDVCISSVQKRLGYSCDLDLLKKGDKIAGITWRGYEDD